MTLASLLAWVLAVFVIFGAAGAAGAKTTVVKAAIHNGVVDVDEIFPQETLQVKIKCPRGFVLIDYGLHVLVVRAGEVVERSAYVLGIAEDAPAKNIRDGSRVVGKKLTVKDLSPKPGPGDPPAFPDAFKVKFSCLKILNRVPTDKGKAPKVAGKVKTARTSTPLAPGEEKSEFVKSGKRRGPISGGGSVIGSADEALPAFLGKLRFGTISRRVAAVDSPLAAATRGVEFGLRNFFPSQTLELRVTSIAKKMAVKGGKRGRAAGKLRARASVRAFSREHTIPPHDSADDASRIRGGKCPGRYRATSASWDAQDPPTGAVAFFRETDLKKRKALLEVTNFGPQAHQVTATTVCLAYVVKGL